MLRFLVEYLTIIAYTAMFFAAAAWVMCVLRIVCWMAFGDWSMSEAGSAVLAVCGAAGGIAAVVHTSREINLES